MQSKSALLAVLLVASIGCGSEDSTGEPAATGGSGGAGQSTWSQRCQSVVDHNASCGKSSADAAAVDDCIATEACVPSVWSPDVVDTIMTCLATLACASPDDNCITMTASDQSSVKQALFTACQDKSAACPSFGGCLETMFLVSDDLASKLAACLDQPCDVAETCMLNEYTAAMTAAGCLGELPFGG